MMRAIWALVVLSVACAEDKPPSLETLRAENESLKAQLAQLRLEAQYELRVCAAPDLMQARLTAIAAQQQVDALNAKPAAVDRKK